MNNEPRSSASRLPQQIAVNVGVPMVALVFIGAALLALIVGLFSPAGGFALLVLGLLATVVIDTFMFQQAGEDAADAAAGGSSTSAGSGGGGGGGSQQSAI